MEVVVLCRHALRCHSHQIEETEDKHNDFIDLEGEWRAELILTVELQRCPPIHPDCSLCEDKDGYLRTASVKARLLPELKPPDDAARQARRRVLTAKCRGRVGRRRRE